ncbi:MAG: hypothetical protein OXT71_17190 [Acidobacteriota bacterium]|nr:hypothetical protein [Acidobacteriota bacterium]
MFVIPDLSVDRKRVLLDECTGDSWLFDNGWDNDAGTHGAYVRDPSWKAIDRE